MNLDNNIFEKDCFGQLGENHHMFPHVLKDYTVCQGSLYVCGLFMSSRLLQFWKKTSKRPVPAKQNLNC